jgi:hypothetical protein
MQFGVHMMCYVFHMVSLLGFPHQQALWSVGSKALFGEEVRVSRRNDSFYGQETSVAMIGM